MARIHRVPQGSVEWHRLRLGIPTASAFHRIITPKTAELSKQARPYMHRLIAERMLCEAFEDNLERVEWIERGAQHEPRAAAHFMRKFQVPIERVGFITDDNHRYGCSPDGLIGSRSLIEIKCPQPWTQMGRLLDGMDEKYRPQVQGQLWISELDLAHFWSWHPQMPEFYISTHRDEEYIAKLARALAEFVAVLDSETNHARKLGVYAPIGSTSGAGMGT